MKVNNIRGQIKYYERIMRNANNQYPRISPHRVFTQVVNNNLSPKQTNWLVKMSWIIDMYRSYTNPLSKIIENDLNGIKLSHLGDSRESTSLVMGALLANGHTEGKIMRLVYDRRTKDLRTGRILNQNIFDTAHELVTVPYKKSNIVIDAWEGFCSNVSEAFKKYQDRFQTHKTVSNNIETSFKPQLILSDNQEELSAQTASKFKELFPELII